MSNQELDISRRKVLAGLGTAGVAAAGAGLGTTAYLNDTESFTGNSMTAGTLDLKVDWQQVYYGPTESQVPVNAYPDHDDDGLQSIDDQTEYGLGTGKEGANEPITLSCGDLVSGDQLPEDVFQSENSLPNQDSLVALDDVKPGDWGEITFSLHLCSNPGYIWLTADNFSEDPGETTEPEPTPDNGELAENTYVELWYDEDCDNTHDRSTEQGQELEVALVSDVSGSMSGSIGDLQSAAKGFVDNLASPDEGAAVSFSDGANLDQPLTTDYQAIKNAIDTYSSGGGTDMTDGIQTARDELINGTEATAGANKVIILLSDGQPNDDSAASGAATTAKNDGIRIFTIALGSADQSFLEGVASNPDDAYVAPDASDLDSVYSDIAQVVVTGEQVILGVGDGTHNSPVSVAEAMDIMDRNGGMIPLDGDGDMDYGAGDTAEARDCFPAESQHCIGMKWWVPEEVGNEIQGDSMSFDLGFYAEQCRHNDGSRPTDDEGSSGNQPTGTP